METMNFVEKNDIISGLSQVIRAAKRSYYKGMPVINDHTYDALEMALARLDPDNDVLNVGFEEDAD